MSKLFARTFDFWTTAVVVLTMILFVVALFLKGLTHDLFLETGVFLVSVKLILLGHKNQIAAQATEAHLQQLQELLRRIASQKEEPC